MSLSRLSVSLQRSKFKGVSEYYKRRRAYKIAAIIDILLKNKNKTSNKLCYSYLINFNNGKTFENVKFTICTVPNNR